jgi:hypothetical protein
VSDTIRSTSPQIKHGSHSEGPMRLGLTPVPRISTGDAVAERGALALDDIPCGNHQVGQPAPLVARPSCPLCSPADPAMLPRQRPLCRVPAGTEPCSPGPWNRRNDGKLMSRSIRRTQPLCRSNLSRTRRDDGSSDQSWHQREEGRAGRPRHVGEAEQADKGREATERRGGVGPSVRPAPVLRVDGPPGTGSSA